jgi:hypothetical protein
MADRITRAKGRQAALPGKMAGALACALRGPSARALTPGEATVLHGAFGDAIDLGRSHIVDGAGHNPVAAIAFVIGGNPAIAQGPIVHVRSDHHCTDFSASAAGINLLVHEFMHVHQYQSRGTRRFLIAYARDLLIARSRNAVYDYAARECGFGAETIEGQAQMVGDYAGWRAGEAKLSAEDVRCIERRLAGTGLFGL